jgi:hypothetical protein
MSDGVLFLYARLYLHHCIVENWLERQGGRYQPFCTGDEGVLRLVIVHPLQPRPVLPAGEMHHAPI